MKKTTHRQAGAKNNRRAQSNQSRKTTSGPLRKSRAQPKAAESKHTTGAARTWTPDNAWHAQQWAYRSKLQGLSQMQTPVEIARDESLAEGCSLILYARDSEGKEFYFHDHPKYQHPGERCVDLLPQKDAFALICMWVTPRILVGHMVKVLRKAGAW